ncbi:adenylate/guanylate cyclase domain-containing protein [Candidatus Gracilibacteria bacterium]|nr:adenylate/guanylate cyclase domain-containing protein [Candidatus Gracilibacteria bacterium]
MQKLRNLKHIFVVIILSLLAAISVIFFSQLNSLFNEIFIYRTGDNTWQDTIYKHSLAPSNDIAIVRIDEKTLNEFRAKADTKEVGIPKSKYIELIDLLRSWGVKGMAFDILLQNADTDEGKLAKKMQEKNDIVIATTIQNLCLQKYDDLRISHPDLFSDFPFHTNAADCQSSIIDMLQYASSKGFFKAEYRIFVGNSGSTSMMQKLRFYCTPGLNGFLDCPGLPREVYKSVPWGLININDAQLRELTTNISNTPQAILKATGTGSSSELLQIDTLPLALYNLNHPRIDVDYTGNYKSIQSSLLEILNPNKYSSENREILTLQPYFGVPNKSYVSFSLSDVLVGGEKHRDAYRGKYVFIGESGTRLHDYKISPVTNGKMDGVELHAHFFDGLLQDKMLTQMPATQYFGMVTVLIILFVIFYYYFSNFLALIIAFATIPVVTFYVRYMYDFERVLVDVLPLFFATSFVFLITFAYKFLVVDREKRQLKSNFAHYIDSHVVDEIVDKSDSIELGGEKRELSVLFSDIAGFTSISETMDTRELFYMMTTYLSYMTDIMIKEGGTLDKYIGDAVMGFFGAPISYEDHAIRSANTAILMRKALAKFNMEIGARGIESIDFRVGIASGEVMVGNIGSKDRFNYTVLGDTVNLASRLEGTGKEYEVHIIISHATKIALTPHFFTRELDTIAVKGKSEGVRIYELVGYGEEYVNREKYIIYERALGLYRAGDYRGAGKLWQTQVSLDPPSRIMMLRCAEILKGNMQVKDGVYHMTHK